MTIRKRIWEIVEVAKENDWASKAFDIFIVNLILLNVLAVILDTVPSMNIRFGSFFNIFEIFSIVIFTLEYLARLWSCVEDCQYRHPIYGRLKYSMRFMSIIDLAAFLPFYLPFLGLDLRFLRILRIFRIIRAIKIGRYFDSLSLIGNVFKEKKEELILSGGILLLLLVLSSCIMFYCENPTQPDAFPDIPSTMWWAVATLTTIGYGDVYPKTIMGKIISSVIAILGIGMFALPTGIIGSGFVEEIQKRKDQKSVICPFCGKTINK